MSGATEIPWKVRLAVLWEADLTDEDERERIGDAVEFGPFPAEVALRLARLMRGGTPGEAGGRIDVSLLPDLAAFAERMAEGGEDE